MTALWLAMVLSACVVERPVPIATDRPSDCGGTGTELMRLEGDLDEQPQVWLVGVDSGREYSAVWPDGYSAAFAPRLELRNRLGETFARQGDILEIRGDEMIPGSVHICSILSVNHASPPPEPIPTAVPVPSRRPTHVPPPAAMGVIELEVCGETDEGYEALGQFVIRFEPQEGQPGRVFPVRDDDCEKLPYRVAAGRYVIEISSPGWVTYRTDVVEVLQGPDSSGGLGIALRPDPSSSPDE